MKYYNSGASDRYEELTVEPEPYKIRVYPVKMEWRDILEENSNKKMQSLPKKEIFAEKGR